MAKIIYKEGLEGQNRLESIEGIEIELLNGQKALIYPKYSEEVMLEKEEIPYYIEDYLTEFEALKKTENLEATGELFACHSPATKFAALFRSDKHGIFALPTLLAAMEIQDQKEVIDRLAKTIEGADLLRDFTSDIWSCSRYNNNLGWVAVGSFVFADKVYLCGSCLAVPTILYMSGEASDGYHTLEESTTRLL